MNTNEIFKSKGFRQLQGMMRKVDEGLALHCSRTANLAQKIAGEMGFFEEEQKTLFAAAQVFEVGKVFVPEKILNIHGSLDETQKAIVDTHSYIGYQAAKFVDMPRGMCEIILYHHGEVDRFIDYEEPSPTILKLAGILRVADAYDAMTHDRPYHQKLAQSIAISNLRRDDRFDNGIVDILEKVIKTDSEVKDLSVAKIQLYDPMYENSDVLKGAIVNMSSNLVITGIMIHDNPEEGIVVKFPHQKEFDEDGNVVYNEFFYGFSEDLIKDVKNKVLAEYFDLGNRG